MDVSFPPKLFAFAYLWIGKRKTERSVSSWGLGFKFNVLCFSESTMDVVGLRIG